MGVFSSFRRVSGTAEASDAGSKDVSVLAASAGIVIRLQIVVL